MQNGNISLALNKGRTHYEMICYEIVVICFLGCSNVINIANLFCIKYT